MLSVFKRLANGVNGVHKWHAWVFNVYTHIKIYFSMHYLCSYLVVPLKKYLLMNGTFCATLTIGVYPKDVNGMAIIYAFF